MYDKTPYLLIADDHADVLEMLRLAATQRGWKCDTATSAQEIVQKVQEHCGSHDVSCYDLLIIDVHYWKQQENQQRITGIAAVRAIRKQFTHLPVIFITAYDTKMVRDEALAVGQEIIAKPFEIDYVLERARVWMDWARPRMFQGTDRRRYGINRSGYYRRASDGTITITALFDTQDQGAMKKAI